MKAVIRTFAFCALAAAACGDPETNDNRGYTKAPLEHPTLLIRGEQPTDMALLRDPLTPVIHEVPLPDTTPAEPAPAEQPGTAGPAELPEGVTQEMVAAGQEVYGGAGFAMPQGDLDGQSVNVTLHDASLKLMEHTPGFVDLLTPAKVSGTFTAENNPRKTRQAHFAMSQIVTDALGRSIFVNAADEPATGLAMRP